MRTFKVNEKQLRELMYIAGETTLRLGDQPPLHFPTPEGFWNELIKQGLMVEETTIDVDSEEII